MYGMVKEVRVARKLFDEMLEPDLVAWNTVIDCYDCCGEYREGLELFSRMHDAGVRPHRITRSCFHVCMFVVWSINMKESQVVTWGKWTEKLLKKSKNSKKKNTSN